MAKIVNLPKNLNFLWRKMKILAKMEIFYRKINIIVETLEFCHQKTIFSNSDFSHYRNLFQKFMLQKLFEVLY